MKSTCKDDARKAKFNFIFQDYDFRASDKNSDHPIPSWAWALTSFLLFASHTLDGIDGKQARRTGTSSPLGELFDHGCDAWAAGNFQIDFYDSSYA